VNLEKNQEIAAAKAGMDRKTARKYLRARRLPSELPQAPRQRFQLGDGDGLLLGEFRKPVRRLSERDSGSWERSRNGIGRTGCRRR
jgi:hypothetical protein